MVLVHTCSHPNSQERVNINGASPFENGENVLARYGMFVFFSILKSCSFAIDFNIATFNFDLMATNVNHDFQIGARFLGEYSIRWGLSTMSRDKGPCRISIVSIGHIIIGTDGFGGGNTWA